MLIKHLLNAESGGTCCLGFLTSKHFISKNNKSIHFSLMVTVWGVMINSLILQIRKNIFINVYIYL